MTFYFENDCILTIRTSGTEPKIKWYSEIKENKSLNKYAFTHHRFIFYSDILQSSLLTYSRTREEIKNELDDIVKHMVDEFYQPTENNFKARST